MDLFELCAHISLDSSEYEQGIEKAEKKGSKFGENLKNVLKQVGKIGAAAVSSAATGVGAIIKNSVEEFANYEQLVGGVETLFAKTGTSFHEMYQAGIEAGKTLDEIHAAWFDEISSVTTVLENADKAYKTAGLSANDYMETVTSFSASLLQGLAGDTEAAAEYADMAIIDMADNANKMGTSIEMIQSAYQGFAKQNYTMLDNLKLGYGGTQEEMARLINDSGVLGDTITVTAKTVNDVSFDKIIEAIHVMQTEMGITGTTSKEASSTIAGSVASMKAAWSNLIVAMADEESLFEEKVQAFVETVGVTAENIIPRINVALRGASDLIDEVVPIIIDQVPTIVGDMLPDILESGVRIVQSIANGILDSIGEISDTALEVMDILVDGIIDALPDIVVAGTMLTLKLADGLIKAIPDLISRIPEIIRALVEGFANHWPDFVDVGKSIVTGIIEGLASAWNRITSWIGAQPLNIAGETVWVNGSHAGGLDYVPYDGYVAKLHRGEMVLTKDEALAMRNGAVGASVNVVQNIYSRAMSAAALMEEALHQQERAVYLGT